MSYFYACALVVNQAYKVECGKSHMPVVQSSTYINLM